VTSTALWAPKAPAKSIPRSRWELCCYYGSSTQQRSVPLALALLVLGPRCAFTRFFEISCRRFEISIRRPEAHFARCGPIGTTVSLLLNGSAGVVFGRRSAGSNGAANAVSADCGAALILNTAAWSRPWRERWSRGCVRTAPALDRADRTAPCREIGGFCHDHGFNFQTSWCPPTPWNLRRDQFVDNAQFRSGERALSSLQRCRRDARDLTRSLSVCPFTPYRSFSNERNRRN
jgi:hypothetical protein